MIWAGNVTCMRKTKNAYRILVGKRSLPKLLWRGWEDKIWIGFKGSWEGVDWILLAQDRDNWRDVMQTCGFHEMQSISSLAVTLLAPQQGICSKELAFRRLLFTPTASFTVHKKVTSSLLHENKSTHITFSLKRETCPAVTLNGQHIPQGESAKYLRHPPWPQADMAKTHLYQKKTAWIASPPHVLDHRKKIEAVTRK